jgi:hypothetical protein
LAEQQMELSGLSQWQDILVPVHINLERKRNILGQGTSFSREEKNKIISREDRVQTICTFVTLESLVNTSEFLVEYPVLCVIQPILSKAPTIFEEGFSRSALCFNMGV